MKLESERVLLSLPRGHEGAVWLYRPRSGPPRSFHRHDELEWNLVVSGHASYLIDDRRYDLTRGSEIWLFPEQDHLLIDESGDYEMWIVVCRPSLLERIVALGGDRALSGQLPPPGHYTRCLSDPILDRLNRLCEDVHSDDTEDPVLHAGVIYLLQRAWRYHLQAEGLTPRTELHPAVERAVRLIRDEEEASTIAGIAAASGLSESQLSRLFRKQVGMTMVRFRQARRLERFLVLYGKGKRRNLTEAAFEAGFGSYSHFHRAFRAVYGLSPRAYHRRIASS